MQSKIVYWLKGKAEGGKAEREGEGDGKKEKGRKETEK